MSMKQWITNRIKKLFENTESTITTVIVLAFFGGSASILALSKKASTFFLQILNTPTPLWATILLVLLCCLYTYLKASQYLSKNNPSNDPIIELKEIGNFKWKTIIHKNGNFDVSQIPYCKEHEIKLVPHGISYFCPALHIGCKSQIKKEDLKLQYDIAKSFIEGMINKIAI